MMADDVMSSIYWLSNLYHIYFYDLFPVKVARVQFSRSSGFNLCFWMSSGFLLQTLPSVACPFCRIFRWICCESVCCDFYNFQCLGCYRTRRPLRGVSLYLLHALSLVVMDDVDCIVITPCDRAREIVLALVTSPMCFNICYLERTFNHFYYVCCFGFAI